MKQYAQHPLSSAFPSLQFTDLEELSDDIRRNGLLEPITLFENKILDGWHRYQAGNMVGADLRFVEYNGSNPIAFVIAKNLQRRHLTPSQRAGIAVKCFQWKSEGRPHKEDTEKLGKIAQFSSKEAAEVVNVSERTVKAARAAEKHGLGDKVRNGEISAHAAARNGQPAPKRKPEPQPESPSITDLQERIEELEEVLKDYEACNQELEQLRKIVEADQPLLEAHKEIKRLTELVRILEERQVGLMNAEASAIRSAKSWKRKYEQLDISESRKTTKLE